METHLPATLVTAQTLGIETALVVSVEIAALPAVLAANAENSTGTTFYRLGAAPGRKPMTRNPRPARFPAVTTAPDSICLGSAIADPSPPESLRVGLVVARSPAIPPAVA